MTVKGEMYMYSPRASHLGGCLRSGVPFGFVYRERLERVLKRTHPL